MTAKHTPGPWIVERATNQIGSEAGDGKTHPIVNGWRVRTHEYERDPAGCEAEARLIAEAPAMRELLERIARYLAPDFCECDSTHAKAGTECRPCYDTGEARALLARLG